MSAPFVLSVSGNSYEAGIQGGQLEIGFGLDGSAAFGGVAQDALAAGADIANDGRAIGSIDLHATWHNLRAASDTVEHQGGSLARGAIAGFAAGILVRGGVRLMAQDQSGAGLRAANVDSLYPFIDRLRAANNDAQQQGLCFGGVLVEGLVSAAIAHTLFAGRNPNEQLELLKAARTAALMACGARRDTNAAEGTLTLPQITEVDRAQREANLTRIGRIREHGALAMHEINHSALTARASQMLGDVVVADSVAFLTRYAQLPS